MFSLGKEIILFNHQEQDPCNAIGSFSFLFSEDGSIGRVKLFFKTELEKVLNGTLTVLTSQKTVPLKEKIIKIKKVSKKVLTSDKIHYIIAKQVTERTTNKPPETSTIWNLSSAGRASALQAEGHRFEPYRFHMPQWRNWQTPGT